jgi:hypothetical protein
MFTQKQIEAAAEFLKKNQHLLSWSELAKGALEAAEAAPTAAASDPKSKIHE